MENQQFFLSPELAPRLAAVDVGTNSIRLIVAEGLRDGKYRILDDEREATRLGRNLSSTGRLDPQAVELSLAALRRMKQIAAGYQVRQVRAIATCAVREASDGPDFCQRVKAETGFELEVISGREEARLAFVGIARGFELEGKNVVAVDIGGGSTEILLASGGLVEEIYTTQLGAVRLTELHNSTQVVAAEAFRKLMGYIERQLRKRVSKRLFVPHVLIGSGGTFTSLATMVMARRGQSALPLQGFEVTQADVRHLLDRLRKMPAKARRSVAGLSADRADIIVAGLAIVDGVMRRFRVNRLQVHVGGIRDGLLLSMVDEMRVTAPQAALDRESVIASFAASCGVDVEHCRHVALLAGSIYAQMAPYWELPPDDRPLLEVAAQLQDVGYMINYQQHHKHSYHLILNSRLPGFQPQELALVANVARYHRGSRPKKSHENFERLSKADRLRVKRMAAILRLAVGFDRSHSRQVQAVEVVRSDDCVELRPRADEFPEVDIWGARGRAEMFEKVFATKLRIEFPGEPKQAAPPAENGAASEIAPAAPSAIAESAPVDPKSQNPKSAKPPKRPRKSAPTREKPSTKTASAKTP